MSVLMANPPSRRAGDPVVLRVGPVHGWHPARLGLARPGHVGRQRAELNGSTRSWTVSKRRPTDCDPNGTGPWPASSYWSTGAASASSPTWGWAKPSTG